MHRLALALALALLAVPGLVHAQERTRVLLTEIPPDDGLPEGTARTLNRVLEGEVRRAVPDIELVTFRAVRANLEVAEMAQCLGDAEAAACATDLGNALGVDLVATPRVGRLGKEIVLTISVYRLADATVVGQATRRTADEARFVDQVRPAVEEAFTPTGLRVERAVAVEEPSGPTLWPWLFGGAGVSAAFVAVAAGLAIHGGAALFLALPYDSGVLSRDGARFWESNAFGIIVAGWALYGVGALAGTSGLALGLLVE